MWKVYVGNLSSRIREMELSKEFSTYGLVKSIWIARNPPGYAFVEFDSRQEAHDAVAALDGKHGWRVEMSRRSSGGIRSRSSSRDTRCQECGSHRHNTRDCRFRASRSSRRSSSPHSRAHMSRDIPKRRRSRSRSRQHADQLNERTTRNHEDSFPVKSECIRSPQNIQNRSPSACSAAVNEDGRSQKIGSSSQNDLIDVQIDGYHSSKELEQSSSPQSGSGRSPNVQKGFESDGPAISEPDLSGLSKHMICGNSPSPSA
ncbi:serine/arginine-rich splicing factor RSZ21A-like isoform X2 [Phalaenopsis equestris]|uniref:serine/arginine-rich splicing factor RSZ21A-like isoform X2 n=1 Tax=Phalaenopsis equestris TaxID=78828 RepID=UPI0009E5E9B1|nr:serine/arginine-rich splicing factor RSZ21A-like isoform X2 [Phalaenopsis equestris]